jgi:2-hydroxy-3-keto-5-methylthiopentenyl-1-phosphate phosphatase
MGGVSRSDLRALVLCDFDGTITLDDMTNVVWDRFLPYDWRARLLSDFNRGQINATELVRRGYAGVEQSEEEVLALMRQRLRVRPGFGQLRALCERQQWRFAVVSNGLRFYIEAALEPHTEIWAHEARFDRRWQIGLPPSMRLLDGEDFKSRVIAHLKHEHPSARSIYLGDGRLDLEPAQLCDHIFAVRGSELERLCQGANIPVRGFTDFNEVVEQLEELHLGKS